MASGPDTGHEPGPVSPRSQLGQGTGLYFTFDALNLISKMMDVPSLVDWHHLAARLDFPDIIIQNIDREGWKRTQSPTMILLREYQNTQGGIDLDKFKDIVRNLGRLDVIQELDELANTGKPVLEKKQAGILSSGVASQPPIVYHRAPIGQSGPPGQPPVYGQQVLVMGTIVQQMLNGQNAFHDICTQDVTTSTTSICDPEWGASNHHDVHGSQHGTAPLPNATTHEHPSRNGTMQLHSGTDCLLSGAAGTTRLSHGAPHNVHWPNGSAHTSQHGTTPRSPNQIGPVIERTPHIESARSGGARQDSSLVRLRQKSPETGEGDRHSDPGSSDSHEPTGPRNMKESTSVQDVHTNSDGYVREYQSPPSSYELKKEEEYIQQQNDYSSLHSKTSVKPARIDVRPYTLSSYLVLSSFHQEDERWREKLMKILRRRKHEVRCIQEQCCDYVRLFHQVDYVIVVYTLNYQQEFQTAGTQNCDILKLMQEEFHRYGKTNKRFIPVYDPAIITKLPDVLLNSDGFEREYIHGLLTPVNSREHHQQQQQHPSPRGASPAFQRPSPQGPNPPSLGQQARENGLRSQSVPNIAAQQERNDGPRQRTTKSRFPWGKKKSK